MAWCQAVVAKVCVCWVEGDPYSIELTSSLSGMNAKCRSLTILLLYLLISTNKCTILRLKLHK